MKSLKLAAFIVTAVLVSSPAFAQFDIGGRWILRGGQDSMESGPGPDPVDYLGVPLNEEGKAKALSFDYAIVGLPEGQCGYLAPFYIANGPFGVIFDRNLDPVSGRLVGWTITGWSDKAPQTIWLDGRPHPGPSAPHTYAGFTTGKWEGDTLTTYTTHLKANMIKRNGAPQSDQATMTMHFVRHGNLLTGRIMLDDPVYLSEPQVRSRVWQLDPNPNYGNGLASPCEPVAEVPRADSAVVIPHYLPGKNPFVNELTEIYNIPQEAVLGGAETMYPEYRKKLTTYKRPDACIRYCGCGGLGVPCITDGSRVPSGGR